MLDVVKIVMEQERISTFVYFCYAYQHYGNHDCCYIDYVKSKDQNCSWKSTMDLVTIDSNS